MQLSVTMKQVGAFIEFNCFLLGILQNVFIQFFNFPFQLIKELQHNNFICFCVFCVQSVGVCLLCTQLITLLVCQVQGGIITNQQQGLGLPTDTTVDSVASPSIPVSASAGSTNSNSDSNSGKNESRSGRVMYTASYSNVRISSKEPKDPKSLKYFPNAVMAKKSTLAAAKIVPVLQTSTTTTSTTPSAPTTTTAGTTTTTSTTTPQPPHPEEETPRVGEVEGTLPIDIVELIEDSEPDRADAGEVVTETILGSTASGNSASEEVEDTELGVTELNPEE